MNSCEGSVKKILKLKIIFLKDLPEQHANILNLGFGAFCEMFEETPVLKCDTT